MPFELARSIVECAKLCPDLGNDAVDYVRNYATTKDDTVFAKMYVDLFSFTRGIASKFRRLDEADKLSLSYSCLYRAFVSFNPEIGVSFGSFYGVLLYRQYLSAIKRLPPELLSIDEAVEVPDIAVNASFQAVDVRSSIFSTPGLTKDEIRFCEVILEQDPPKSELKDILGVTAHRLTAIRQALTYKFDLEIFT